MRGGDVDLGGDMDEEMSAVSSKLMVEELTARKEWKIENKPLKYSLSYDHFCSYLTTCCEELFDNML